MRLFGKAFQEKFRGEVRQIIRDAYRGGFTRGYELGREARAGDVHVSILEQADEILKHYGGEL